MHLEVHGEPGEGRIEARVKLVEDLGSYKIVTLTLAEKIVKARVLEDHPIRKDRSWLGFPKQWTRLFSDGWLIK